MSPSLFISPVRKNRRIIIEIPDFNKPVIPDCIAWRKASFRDGDGTWIEIQNAILLFKNRYMRMT